MLYEKRVSAGILTDWGGVSDPWPEVWQVSKVSVLSIPTPFYCPEVSWNSHYGQFHYLGKADTLYPCFLPCSHTILNSWS